MKCTSAIKRTDQILLTDATHFFQSCHLNIIVCCIKMADIFVKNMKKPHPADCPDAWLKFRCLQSVSIQSRDGCCSLLIQFPQCCPFCLFWITRGPLHWPSGNQAREMVSFLTFSSFFQSELQQKLTFLWLFITVILKVFSYCLSVLLPAFLVYFYHFS